MVYRTDTGYPEMVVRIHLVHYEQQAKAVLFMRKECGKPHHR